MYRRMNDLISIIMPAYNRGYIIERAIQSVLEQTYQNWELIIVDDASADNTLDVVKKYISSKVLYFTNQCNKGANASRNYGIEKSKGKWITFLDSDNYWPVDRLEHQLAQIDKVDYEKFFCFGQTQIKKMVFSQ